MFCEERKVEYFENEEKRIVVCKISGCETALICDLCHKEWPGDEALLLNESYVGKAVCSPEDTFDIETGRRIAYDKAMIKLNKAKTKTLMRFLDKLKKMNDMAEKDFTEMKAHYENDITFKLKDIEKAYKGE